MLAATLMLLAGASDAAVVLRGRIDAAVPQPVAGRGASEVTIGAPTRIKLRIRRVEAGRWRGGTTFETIVPMASLPSSEPARDVLILVERDGAGWRPVAWDRAAAGLCVPDDYAAAHGLARAWPGLKARRIVACD